MVQNSVHFIQNSWVKGSGDPFKSVNPATGELIWEGSSADIQDVIFALKSARTALPSWRAFSFDKRVGYVKSFQKLVEKNKARFADVISRETGKPLWESLGEVQAVANKIDISIKSFEERCPKKTWKEGSCQVEIVHHPKGVLGVLGPFNLPAHLPNGHIIPALLAGNTVVFKPSEQTPLVAETMLKLWQQVDLPPGVLNMVQGGFDAGQTLALHPDLDGLLFTGSSGAGKSLAMSFGRHPEKILVLEMGGNNPLIVSQIGDVAAAVYATIQSAFITSGQRCTCARRLIVVESEISQSFCDQLASMTGKIKVGAYTNKTQPFMGPVISLEAAKKLLEAQGMLRNLGGKVLVEMVQEIPNLPFLTPGIIDVTGITDLPDRELFGPLLKLVRVPTIEAAIKEANRTRYGLSAGVLTDDKQEFKKIRSQLRAGIVNWNSPTTGASSKAPFGGIQGSGNHRPTAFYAADYCSTPVASRLTSKLVSPTTFLPGIPEK
ncbi:MAG: succinylglutamic semialdehyde dehydrogenase [Candidatus Marinamargulisbacteria bacterium]|jgi:succinylglutamic semialdehyde dehydrogenase